MVTDEADKPTPLCAANPAYAAPQHEHGAPCAHHRLKLERETSCNMLRNNHTRVSSYDPYPP